MGISNEDILVAWIYITGEPIHRAIVRQCPRGVEICHRLKNDGSRDMRRYRSDCIVTEFFTAKWACILENVDGAAELAEEGNLCCADMG